jgi:hypothetical protein
VSRALALALALLLPLPGQAFYAWQRGDGSGDVRGLVRAFASYYRYPEDEFFYPDRSAAGLAGLARLMTQGRHGSHFGFEANVYQTYLPEDMVLGQVAGGAPLDTERSAALDWSFSDDDYVHFAVDRLNLRFTHERLDLRVGRQPVNLATTFYFTPNDFFGRFAAQAFFRVYKPGVDAARADWRLGELSNLSLIGVLGYRPDAASDTGWSGNPDRDRASYLARAATVVNDREVALIAGRVRRNDVLGASLQGEWFDWLGVRAEGHVAWPRDDGSSRHSEFSVGLEHRWASSLELRAEYYHHGAGKGDAGDYLSAVVPDSGGYLARRYAAFGAGYECTPLLNGQALLLRNLVDDSMLLSLYAVYSLADEAELAISAALPFGDQPDGADIESEFGLFPYSATIEVRSYF